MPHSINLWKLVTGCWPNDTLSLLNAKKHWKGKTDWFDFVLGARASVMGT
jgi:hypothetical protein